MTEVAELVDVGIRKIYIYHTYIYIHIYSILSISCISILILEYKASIIA